MSRAQKTVKLAGQAGDLSSGALQNPLNLISQPLYLDQDGQSDPDLQRWEMPAVDKEDGAATSFSTHLSKDAIVVIGGYDLFQVINVKPNSLRDNVFRNEAANLMVARGIEPIRDKLKYRESSISDLTPEKAGDSLIGKGKISRFFAHSPSTTDSGLTNGGDIGESRAQRRKYHPLRVRRAIDLITTLEVYVEHRLSLKNEGPILRTALSEYMAIDEKDVSGEKLWDWFWLEPVHYVVNLRIPAKQAHMFAQNPGLCAEFKSRVKSNVGFGALYWFFRGVPGKYANVKAACDAHNVVFQGILPKIHPTTIDPEAFDQKIDLFMEGTKASSGLPKSFREKTEYIPEMCP